VAQNTSITSGHLVLFYLQQWTHIIVLFLQVLGVKVGYQMEAYLIIPSWQKKNYDESLNLPSPKALPGQQEKSPYVFVCDDDFPFKENLMKPFPGTYLRGSP